MGSNREKSNNAIARLEKLPVLKGTENYCACVGWGEVYFSCRYSLSLFSW